MNNNAEINKVCELCLHKTSEALDDCLDKGLESAAMIEWMVQFEASNGYSRQPCPAANSIKGSLVARLYGWLCIMEKLDNLGTPRSQNLFNKVVKLVEIDMPIVPSDFGL